jgi:hypothetical protein
LGALSALLFLEEGRKARMAAGEQAYLAVLGGTKTPSRKKLSCGSADIRISQEVKVFVSL